MACVKPAPPPLKPPRFDQERAFQRLRDLCAFGPRNHGSEGKTKAEAWIQKNLRDAGAEVSVHSFQHTPKGATQAESFRNIVARINPALKTRRAPGRSHTQAGEIQARWINPKT